MTKLLASFVISAIYVSVVLAETPRSLNRMTIESHWDKGTTGALSDLAGGYLAIIDGKPALVSSPSALREWSLRETDKGWTIQVDNQSFDMEGKVKDDNQYLAVDKEGKVTMAVPGEGAYWKLNLNHIEGTTHDVGGEIRASGGKFDGWYLGFSDKAHQFKDSQVPKQLQALSGRYTYPMYDPELSEKSGARTKFRLYVDGP
jgi:hypothetical protein